MIRTGFLEVLDAGERGKDLSSGEIEFLLAANPEEREALFQAADRVRRRFVGEEIHLRGIVEFSNICIQNWLILSWSLWISDSFSDSRSPKESFSRRKAE